MSEDAEGIGIVILEDAEGVVVVVLEDAEDIGIVIALPRTADAAGSRSCISSHMVMTGRR